MKCLPFAMLQLCCTLFFLLSGSCLAADMKFSALQGPEPVQIDADSLSYDRQEEVYQAVGSVTLRKGSMTLLAEEVWWRPETGEAQARGNVRLQDPQGQVKGDQLSLNLQSGRGLLKDGEIFLHERNLHIAGEEIERLSPVDYRIEQGEFTTCDGDNPAWKFKVSELNVELGELARGRHARFYLKGLPVFYLPYVLYPIKSDRESGLLMPRYGYSQERGWELSAAYYQVIARNQDLTFYLDYFSDLGIGTGAEYRYIFDRQEGKGKIYHVAGFADGEGALALSWRNRGWLPGRVRSVADIEYVDDENYYSRFGEVAGEYNKDKTESKVFLSRSWGKNTLTAQMKYLQNLDRDTDLTLQRLPEVRFAAIRRRIGDTPLFTNLDVRYDHFWREEGETGQRLFLRPAFSAPFQLGMVEISPEVGFSQRFYHASGETEENSIADFNLRLSSALGRVYSAGERIGSIRKLQHIVSPEVIYTYIPRSDQSNLPYFGRDDRLGPVHRIAYALTNRLTAKIEPVEGRSFYHEFLYFRLSQEYDIIESSIDPLNPRDNLKPFSDLRAELLLRPTRWGYLEFDTRYDFETEQGHSMQVSTLNFDAGLTDSRGNGLTLGYRYLRDDLEYADATVHTALLKPLYASYRQRYDFRNGSSLEKVLDLEYRSQCWSVLLTLRDRRADTEFLVTFTLSGLGRVAEFGGALGGEG